MINDDSLRLLGNQQWFSTMDLASGYFVNKKGGISPGHSPFQSMGWHREGNGNWLSRTKRHSTIPRKHVPYFYTVTAFYKYGHCAIF